jgi:hypothetical protein
VRICLAILGDLIGVGRIECELEKHAVRVFDINRPAIAVLQHKRVGVLIACRLDALLDRFLCLLIDLERYVMKGCLCDLLSANWKNASAPPSARPKKQ